MEPGADANIAFLLQQLKQGSEPAFNALYRLHSKMLLGNIRNLVKDQEVAKELLQDLYLKFGKTGKPSIPTNLLSPFCLPLAVIWSMIISAGYHWIKRRS